MGVFGVGNYEYAYSVVNDFRGVKSVWLGGSKNLVFIGNYSRELFLNPPSLTV